MKSIPKLLIIAVLMLCLNACSTLRVNDDVSKHQSADPFEGLNRSIYAFNDKADKLILRPIAKTYSNTLPTPAKKGVSNFFSNLTEPLNALNNLLQGKVDRALTSTYRFTVNSTIGVFGLIDVASKYGVEPAAEDFGQTLAAWGVGPGPYLMLPFLGPTNLRHGVGRITDTVILNPINEITNSSDGRVGLRVLGFIDLRTGLLGTDKVLDSQLDPYGFLKQAYERNRLVKLYDGNPPEIEEEFDF